MSYNYACIHECGDEDCGKCMVHGIIMYCPCDCPDYESRLPKPTEKPKPQKDDKLTRIEGVVMGCEEILSDPDSTPIIRKCAIDTAYKHIARIIKGAENG